MNEHLKEHFIDLLLEEYKLTAFIWQLMNIELIWTDSKCRTTRLSLT